MYKVLSVPVGDPNSPSMLPWQVNLWRRYLRCDVVVCCVVAHKTCVVVLFTSFGLRTLCHDLFFFIRTLFVVVTISPPRSLFQAGGQLGPKKLKTIARGITAATAAALLPEHGGAVKYSKT